MGLLDFFRKQPPVSLEQISYDIAYQIFPQYAYGQLQALQDIVQSSPDTANSLFYLAACKSLKVRPDKEAAAQYRWHQIPGFGARRFLVLEYPTPVPIDLSGKSFVEVRDSVGTWVLAPHFSAVVKNDQTGKVDYFVLGQTSKGGGTALRMINADWENSNLGPGPAPSLDAFVSHVQRYMDGAPAAP
jgi:hypothetical protein